MDFDPINDNDNWSVDAALTPGEIATMAGIIAAIGGGALGLYWLAKWMVG